MKKDSTYRPKLRPVEVFRVAGEDNRSIGLRDRSGLSEVVLSMSGPALHLLSLMDGEHTCEEIRAEFHAAFGQPVAATTLSEVVDHLEQAFFLEGPAFDDHYRAVLEEYRGRRVRCAPRGSALEMVDEKGECFRRMLEENGGVHAPVDRVRGLIAPHLDYPRGGPCYAAAYGAIGKGSCPERIVVLGTNHFGRSTSVVGTGHDFETPLGTTSCDRDFLALLEKRCGDLRGYELDHAREHSVELQVAWLQYLFGADSFTIAPFLCPDPCGATGTAPCDGKGVDLCAFAAALAELAADDPRETLFVAGADLSHVGGSFGDERSLDGAFLDEVRESDREALVRLELGDPDGFVRRVSDRGNRTRICSAGCLFVLASALRGGQATTLRYHQAVDLESQTCVTCAAAVFG